MTQVKLNADDLRKQMAIKDETGKQQLRQKYEAGKQIKDELTKEHQTLARIKEQKMQQMRELGIPEKYQVDMVKLKV